MADLILTAALAALCVGSLAYAVKRKGRCRSACKNCICGCCKTEK